MGTVNSRTLATSQPRNLTTGFPIFPAGTSLNNPLLPVRIGLGLAPAFSNNIFRANIPLALWRLSGNVTGQMVLGAFFGFNLIYTVEGVTRNDGTASLRVSGDAAQGGIGVGAGVTIGFNLRVDDYVVEFTFRDGFTSRWRNVFSFVTTVNIDLIEILLRVLRVVGGINIPLAELVEFRGAIGSGAIWGLVSSASSEFTSLGRLQLRPRASLSGNIVQSVPGLAGIAAAVKKIGGKVKVGPAFNVVFPITIRIVRLTTEDGNYDFESRSNGQFHFRGGRVGTLSPTVQNVRMTHSHDVQLEFGFELKASFSLWSLFNLSGTLPLPLNAGNPAPRPNVIAGPFFTTLPPLPQAVGADLPEVIWG